MPGFMTANVVGRESSQQARRREGKSRRRRRRRRRRRSDDADGERAKEGSSAVVWTS